MIFYARPKLYFLAGHCLPWSQWLLQGGQMSLCRWMSAADASRSINSSSFSQVRNINRFLQPVTALIASKASSSSVFIFAPSSSSYATLPQCDECLILVQTEQLCFFSSRMCCLSCERPLHADSNMRRHSLSLVHLFCLPAETIAVEQIRWLM